jgi:hypothetical protein
MLQSHIDTPIIVAIDFLRFHISPVSPPFRAAAFAIAADAYYAIFAHFMN